jgi:hypothetical protein
MCPNIIDSDHYKQELPLIELYTNLPENESDGMQKSHVSKQKKWIYYIEERMKEVRREGFIRL